jgi:hypothetical protein
MNQNESLLGLTGFIDRGKVEDLIHSLTLLWKLSTGLEINTLESDLELCRRWFDPVAQGQRLRRDLPGIPPLPPGSHDPGPPLTFEVTSTQKLITPEGRCAIDLLKQLDPRQTVYVLDDSATCYYDRVLGSLYLKWSRHRINSVVDLLRGEDKPLQIAAAGVVLALLVNRSTSPARALKRFPVGAAQDIVDAAFFRAVEAFSRTLAPKQRATRDPKLISGWMLYEARRRLGEDLLIMETSRPDSGGNVWIDERRQEMAIDVVARDLSRGHRTRITPTLLSTAFDELVDAFRAETGQLAGFGLAHERPVNTGRIKTLLLERFIQRAEDS